jgi:hypothetical protein
MRAVLFVSLPGCILQFAASCTGKPAGHPLLCDTQGCRSHCFSLSKLQPEMGCYHKSV